MKLSEKEKIIEGLCLQHQIKMLFQDSSDDDDDSSEDEIINFNNSLLMVMASRRGLNLAATKKTNWHMNVLKTLNENKFNDLLPFTEEEFSHILSLIKNDKLFTNWNTAPQIPVELQLQITLYSLCTYGENATTRKTATIFGVGLGGTVLNVTNRVVQAIKNIKNNIICWPDEEERASMVYNSFDEMPGCVGVLETLELRLTKPPVRHREVYYSEKMNQFTLKMQVVWDNQFRIRQASCGFPGSYPNEKILKESKMILSPEKFFSAGEWIAGDSDISLMPNIIVPFDEENFDYTAEERIKFNEHFAKYRKNFEGGFERLKEKFGSLKDLKFRLQTERTRKKCNDWILACFILHNALIDFNNKDKSALETETTHILPDDNKRDWLMQFIQTK